MISISEVLETNKMIQDENLDVRTITMGVSLLDCADANLDVVCRNIYAKLLRYAGRLVRTGEDISREFGIPSSTSAYRSRQSPSSARPAAARPATT